MCLAFSSKLATLFWHLVVVVVRLCNALHALPFLSLSFAIFRPCAQVAVCWFVSNRAEGPIFALINTPIMKQVILVLSEVFRANSMCGIVILSNSILKVRARKESDRGLL